MDFATEVLLLLLRNIGDDAWDEESQMGMYFVLCRCISASQLCCEAVRRKTLLELCTAVHVSVYDELPLSSLFYPEQCGRC
jgi:hypothetical protein